MKNIRKIFSVLLIAVLLSVTVFTYTASAASCTVSAGSASGKKGDTVTVNINISNVSLGALTVSVSFDSSKLNCTKYSIGSAGNVLKYKSANLQGSTVSYNGTTDDVKNISVGGTVLSVEFQIISDSGSAVLSVSGVAYDVEYNRISMSTSNGTVNITSSGGGSTPTTPTTPPATQAPQTTAAKSSDATLKSLVVKGVMDSGYLTSVALSPSFSSGTLSYKASIAGDVMKLAVTAVPNDSKAKVNIPAGYLRMDEGSNVTKIIVTAENGAQKVYTIKTEKSAGGVSVTEPITGEIYTQALTEPSTETTTEVDTTAQTNIDEANIEETTSKHKQSETNTDLYAQGLKKSNKNNMYVGLGIAFSAAAVLVLTVSIALFVNEGRKKHKGDGNEKNSNN